MQYDIFISYSRKDTDRVNKFIEAFKNEGFSVWYDKDGIESGDMFKKKIVNAIEKSRVFVFFSSINSNVSEWTTKEIGIAVSRKKKIIPVKFDNSKYNEDIEFDIVNLDYTDCKDNDDEAIATVINGLHKALEQIDPQRKEIRDLRLKLQKVCAELSEKEVERIALVNNLTSLGVKVPLGSPEVAKINEEYQKQIKLKNLAIEELRKRLNVQESHLSLMKEKSDKQIAAANNGIFH